jgi:hypothetical protein
MHPLGQISVGVTLALMLLGSTAAGPRVRTASASAPADYARADTETIRSHLEDILSDPQFAAHKTFWEWLTEKLRRWGGPHLSPEWGRFIAWAVAAWCLLSLLAILGDLAWTIWLLARPQRSSVAPELPGGSEKYETATFEQLWERSAELARAGQYRIAIGMLLLALLRRLDALKVVHFHKSKTNGEYVREYPGQRTGRREFVQFIAAFERSIYGGSDVAGPAYDTMSTLAQQVLRDAPEKPQI